MAHEDGHFLSGEELDDLYFLLGGGLDDADFNVEVDAAVSEVATDQGHSTYKCDQWDKICKSKRGLTRHTKMRYPIGNKNVGKKWLNFGLVTNIYYRLFFTDFFFCRPKFLADYLLPT